MIELIPDEYLDEFEVITSYDLRKYFNDFINFLDFHYPQIISYYEGSMTTPNAISFERLNYLLKETVRVLDLIRINSESFGNYAYYVILHNIEQIQLKLQSTDNASRWLRSSITKNNFNPRTQIDYTLHQRQSLEDVSFKVRNSPDFLNDWAQIALKNDLEEEDYTTEGGVVIKLDFLNSNRLVLNSVVDNIDSALKSYGIDIYRVTTFEDNDLKVLSYRDTLFQSVEILAQLKQGDNPDFPQLGRNEGLFVGGNISSFAYPVLIRQLLATFATDDSLKNLKITNISRKADALYIEFEVETRAGDIVQQSTFV